MNQDGCSTPDTESPPPRDHVAITLQGQINSREYQRTCLEEDLERLAQTTASKVAELRECNEAIRQLYAARAERR